MMVLCCVLKAIVKVFASRHQLELENGELKDRARTPFFPLGF